MSETFRIPDLDLSSDATPGVPLVIIDLEQFRGAAPEMIEHAAGAIGDAIAPVVVVSRHAVPDGLEPITTAATFTLTTNPDADHDPRLVQVSDPDTAVARLRAAVEHAPRAAVACGQLLRQTTQLATTPALAAEAATYSMLLGGPEFATWYANRKPRHPPVRPDRDLVRLERTGDRLSITLDHAERRNALSTAMREELLAAVQLADLDTSITTVEIAGGGPAFCSGGDLDEFGRATDPTAAYLVRLDRAPWRLLDHIADRLLVRLHGACIGAGAEMAAFAGTVHADRGTFFEFPEVRMGLVPGAGGTVSVPRRIGRWRSAWLMLTGERLSAQTALMWGLVDQLTEADPELTAGCNHRRP
ncbi:enoyl-CoA hydratase/isomerase family protein [Nocardia sp. XZ_19_231]|uniref:enoyl-CoA hydratase/isomerase family protein n=1 Tax=Nocardia sp. XZ_19_231 TaxID=2769252 RepID=UPI001E39E6CF|nr:enoyl-CoA hydratase/isomerase family protein [Nocardia sp. XZ_19_231]